MTGLISPRTTGLAALTAATLTFGMVSTAGATTYYACVAHRGGAIHLVSKKTKCRRSERKISFNSEGLHGANGRNGLNGSNGKNGANGANGANGTNGTNGTTGFTSTLPRGQTEKGAWGGAFPANSKAFSPISFNIPLAASPVSTIIEAGGSSTPACPGTVANPSAASGNLCIYAAVEKHVEQLLQFNPGTPGESAGADVFGTIVRMTSTGEAGAAYGTWAVTG